jgi:histidinol-phosphate aminotransferase
MDPLSAQRVTAHPYHSSKEDTVSIDYLALAVRNVNQLAPYVPGKAIDELARETGMATSDIIKLASNESPLGTSQRVADAIMAELTHLTRYPDGNGFRLKSKLSEKFGLDTECITIGNGSNDLLIMLAQAFLAHGRNAVFSRYAFSVYASATIASGAEPREVPDQAWGNDLERILAAIDRDTRIVFVANPNNPTGTWFNRQAFESFLDRVPRETIVVLDEAYIEYADDPVLPNGLDYVDRYPNLVVCRTLCKAYGLAGLRVGYAVSSRRIADILNRVRQPFNVNSLAVAAACAAIDDDAYLQRGREVNRLGLIQLQHGLSGLGLSWIPSRTNFVAVDVGRNAGPVYQGLLGKGIIVRPLAGYGMPSHLRVSVGLESENRRFLTALEEVLSSSLRG